MTSSDYRTKQWVTVDAITLITTTQPTMLITTQQHHTQLHYNPQLHPLISTLLSGSHTLRTLTLLIS